MNAGEWTIRSIEEEDAIRYVEFLNSIDLDTEFLLWEPGERTITPEAVKNQIRNANPQARFHYVAVASDKVVGFLVGIRGTQKRVQHKADFTMGVLSSFGGNGIGKALLQEFEAWARKNELKRIELAVMSHNKRAIELYEKRGFNLEGSRKSSILIRGQFVDENIMGKLL
jgi:RimJ/RimL family protein N-acetyltransferase